MEMRSPPAQHSSTPRLETVFAAQKRLALEWRHSTAAYRRSRLTRLERAVGNYQPRLRDALSVDLHKPVPETDLSEILPVIAEIRHARRHLAGWMKLRRVDPGRLLPGTSAWIRHEPRGTCLIMAPWNYPVALTLGPLACALAAGNTVILKPSEFAPATASVLAELVNETFEPAEVAVYPGDVTQASALLDLPFDHIFFTGSPATGRIVMAAAARHLASVTLELGGRSPVIVDASADLESAARSIVWGKSANCGQTCIAPDHLFVEEGIRERFVSALEREITALYGADSRMSADYGRIVNQSHFERLVGLLEDATRRGAKRIGGPVLPGERLIPPTLLTGIQPGSAILENEIFGPLLPVLDFRNLLEPITAINEQPKPLALYIFSRRQAAIDRIVRETSSGGVGINTTLLQFLHGNLPFGGIGESGIGNSHGFFGFRAFSHERAILRDRLFLTRFLSPPYTGWVRNRIHALRKLA